MNRRKFLKNTCNIACACAAVSVMSVLQSCEDNIDDSYNSNNSGNDDGTVNQDNQIIIDISESPHTALMQVNGTSSLGSNSILCIVYTSAEGATLDELKVDSLSICQYFKIISVDSNVFLVRFAKPLKIKNVLSPKS